MARLTLAFVMDPLAAVNVDTDTSFAFMLAAQDRGHRVVYVPPSGIDLEHTAVHLRGYEVRLQKQRGAPIASQTPLRLPAKGCDAVFIRTDPPFDAGYLLATWLLSFAERDGVWVINSPAGLRAANEKLYSLEFPELCPETLITGDRGAARAFIETLGGEAILKPVDGHGGFGVFRARAGDTNTNALIDMLSLEGRRPLIVQRYVPEGAQGDKRLLLIDGELRGAVRRVPQAGDHRGNVHVGGKVTACELSAADQRIAARLGPRLKQDGLFFVGLDVVGDRLIEVNVTSPTLVQELLRLGGPDLATEVIARVERGRG